MVRLPLTLGLVYAVTLCGTAFAVCPLSNPQWASWQPVNLTTDSKPNKLAVQSLKDYIQGLEQTGQDIRCPWSNATAHVDTACMEAGSNPRYAVRFTYSVPCTMTDAMGTSTSSNNTAQPTVIQGTIEGVLPPVAAILGSVPAPEPVIGTSSPAAEALH